MKSTLDLKAIAAAGGGMILDASRISTLDLRAIASAASTGGGQIILKNSGAKSTLDIRAIASAGSGKVIFDLTA